MKSSRIRWSPLLIIRMTPQFSILYRMHRPPRHRAHTCTAQCETKCIASRCELYSSLVSSSTHSTQSNYPIRWKWAQVLLSCALHWTGTIVNDGDAPHKANTHTRAITKECGNISKWINAVRYTLLINLHLTPNALLSLGAVKRNIALLVHSIWPHCWEKSSAFALISSLNLCLIVVEAIVWHVCRQLIHRQLYSSRVAIWCLFRLNFSYN